jgi:hypothetical protein
MLKSIKAITFVSLIIGALMLSVFLAPFSISQNPVKESNGTPAGWSDDINLSNDVMDDREPSMAVNETHIHAVWEHTYLAGSDYEIVYTRSNDGGLTWVPFVNISQANFRVTEPEIDVSQSNIHVVWEDREGADRIDYSNSTDGGQTWNTIKRISASTGASVGNPDIFVNNSNVHIIWHDFRVGTNGQIFYRRSLNGGISFDNGQGVDEDRQITFSPADIGGVRMAGDGSNISVVWYDERDGDWEIYWMISKDNGFTWQDGLETENVGRQLSDDSTTSASPAVTVNGSYIHIVWYDESWPGPEYRLYYRNSTDNGLTWNPIQIITGPSPLMAKPDIAVSGNNVHVTWDDARDDGTTMEIYYKNSTDGGITWGQDVRLTYSPGSHSYHPKLGLNDTMVHVTWWDLRDGNREIYYKRSPDFLPDTDPPTHSNEIPYPDSYKDAPGTNVSVHVTDPSGVNESTIQLYVNGSPVAYTLTPITNGYNVSYDSGGFGPGIVTCRIVAEDNCTNQLDYSWNFTVLALYGIQLHEGWNLISVPFVQVNTSIKEVLRDIDGKWDFIEYYDSANGDWKSYATFWPESLNEFDEINNTMAIWINITEPNVNLTSRGIISTYTEIQLKAGWNFVGYPTQTTETVANALWGTGADRVEVFDASDPYRLKEVGATYVMKPGEGYWVRVPANSVWIVDW